MVLKLAERLNVPLRERNVLLVAAGYAPAFPQRSLDDPALKSARAAIDLPSGLSADSPDLIGPCLDAGLTVTLAAPTRSWKVSVVTPRCEVTLRLKSMALPQTTVVSTVNRKVSPVAVPWGAMAP